MSKSITLAVTVGAVFIFFAVFFLLSEYDISISKKFSNDKAFLKVYWEMSQSEVEKANQKKLVYPAYPLRKLRDMEGSSLYIANVERFYNGVDSNLQFWGQASKVDYWFFDDKLFTFTVEISGNNSNLLDSLIVHNLSKEYGKGSIKAEQDLSYKYERYWETDIVSVHYWLIESKDLINKDKIISENFNREHRIISEEPRGPTEIDISDWDVYGPYPHRAMVRVKYKPIIEQISKISSEEHSAFETPALHAGGPDLRQVRLARRQPKPCEMMTASRESGCSPDLRLAR